jgi:hypothetical protein
MLDELCINICCTNMQTNAYAYTNSVCNGASFMDVIECRSCNATCPTGTYISPCDGTGYRDTSSCLPCRQQCNLGYYLGSECDGTTWNETTTCNQCVQSCSKGQYMQGMCNGTTNYDTTKCMPCKDCGDLRTIDECDGLGMMDSQKCVACMCQPGQYLSNACVGPETVVECVNCTMQCQPNFYIRGVSLFIHASVVAAFSTN